MGGVQDAVLAALPGFACLPANDPGATILTTGTPGVIDMVLVGGEIVVGQGLSTRVDEQLLTKESAVAVP